MNSSLKIGSANIFEETKDPLNLLKAVLHSLVQINSTFPSINEYKSLAFNENSLTNFL